MTTQCEFSEYDMNYFSCKIFVPCDSFTLIFVTFLSGYMEEDIAKVGQSETNLRAPAKIYWQQIA